MDKIKRLKLACYTSNISMSVVGNLSPLLFLSFNRLYGISFSLLGLLVLANFLTQLTVDLIFSFFSHKFNISKCTKSIPVLTCIGLLIYALWPFVFPNNVYIGLLLGTVVFSASGGFVEVLLSPVIAALPAKDPDKEMSKLHSVYAWGTVGVILVATLFLSVLGSNSWQLITLIFVAVPLVSAFLFIGTDIPDIDTEEKDFDIASLLKNKTLWLCVLAIFLGGAAECTMAQWCSGYLEAALSIPKTVGDIFGTALFALMLGLGRTLYASFGKNIEKVLICGSAAAAVCYGACAVSDNAVIGLIACALTGFCVSMLWPGSLIAATDRISNGGVFLFAIMAAGGDFGASVGPLLLGVVTDAVIAAEPAFLPGSSLSFEQMGMKLGMLIGMLFPLGALILFKFLRKIKK